MQRTLLLDAIRSAKVKHFKLLAKAGEPMPPNATDYDAELVDQYARNESLTNIKIEDVVNEVTNTTDYADIKVSQFIRRWSNFSYSRESHPLIFVDGIEAGGPNSNGTMPRPSYFNRTESEEQEEVANPMLCW